MLPNSVCHLLGMLLQIAQEYVPNPLLLAGGRKFGIRLWAVVAGPDPYRAYLHRNGLVLFSTETYDRDTPYDGSTDGDGGTGSTASRGGDDAGAARGLASGGAEEEAAEEAEDEEEGGGHGQGSDGGDGGAEVQGSPPGGGGGAAAAAAALAAAVLGSGAGPTPAPARGHVTNYAQNVDGVVWRLRQLAAELGQERFG